VGPDADWDPQQETELHCSLRPNRERLRILYEYL